MKVKGLRWWIIGLIGIATVINYIDRNAINIMWPFIHSEFGIATEDSKQALSWITNFFLIAYAIGQTVTGKMMDAIGTRLGMVISIIAWSISIALHAVARSLASFSIFRAMLGISEAGNWPGATKSNAEWFPKKERAIAQGIFGAGASLGAVVSAPFISNAYLAFGWRGTFIGIALLGIIWIIPWLIINKATPDRHKWITKEEIHRGKIFSVFAKSVMNGSLIVLLGEQFISPLDELYQNGWVSKGGVFTLQVVIEDPTGPRARPSDVDRYPQ